MKTILDLSELARDAGQSIEELVRFGAQGELTIFVIADNWPVKSGAEQEDTVDGAVFLVSDDLLRSMNADYTEIRAVKRATDEDPLTLADPKDVMRGVHFVSAEEADRFCRRHALEFRSDSELPPYLNANHEYHATELMIAVQAWMALFADGSFDGRGQSPKHHIQRWLRKQHPKLSEKEAERIATLVNPDFNKKGGSPKTPTK